MLDGHLTQSDMWKAMFGIILFNTLRTVFSDAWMVAKNCPWRRIKFAARTGAESDSHWANKALRWGACC